MLTVEWFQVFLYNTNLYSYMVSNNIRDYPDPLSPLLPIVKSPLAGLQGYIPYPHRAAVCMHVQAGHPAFARPYVGVHRSTSLMSSSLLLQQCPACLLRLTWIVFVMGSNNKFYLIIIYLHTVIWFQVTNNL